MMSGSSRSALRSALLNDNVCGPTSRWLIRHFLLSCTNSIGSSTARMWPNSLSLMSWTRMKGGSRGDRCRSEALFLTTKGRSSEMAIYNSPTKARQDGACRWPRCGSKRLAAFDAYIEICKTIMTTIASRLQAVKARISEAARAAGRAPGEITLVAVSKTFPPQSIAEAYAAGQQAFGENYAQEGIEKITTLFDLLRQRNASPERPLLWHVALPNQDDERTPGDVRPSAGVTSPEGPLLRPM